MSAPLSPRGKSLGKSIQSLISQHLWAKILLGMVFGVGIGLLLSPSGMGLLDQNAASGLSAWIALPGVIFLGMLKMVILPLIICSIVLGISDSGNLSRVRSLGFRLVPYFMMTTAIAISIGLAWVFLIQPGIGLERETMSVLMGAATPPAQTLSDLTVPQRIANMIPVNIVQAAFNEDMLQIVIAAIVAGIVVLTIPKDTSKPFTDLCLFGQVASMRVISWAMAFAPYAVFAMMTDTMLRIGFDAISAVGSYMLTVLLGLLTMLGAYLLIIALLAKRSPWGFLKDIREVQLLAFSTSSSAAVMPLSIRASEEKLGIKPEIGRFVIPIGATINMDGTAMYQAIAAIFLCQFFGIDLSAGEITLLLLTTIGASIGTPAMPGVGIVVLATILSGIGVPPAGIGIILGVDRLLDMCRTTINVTGDLTATAVMSRWLNKA